MHCGVTLPSNGSPSTRAEYVTSLPPLATPNDTPCTLKSCDAQAGVSSARLKLTAARISGSELGGVVQAPVQTRWPEGRSAALSSPVSVIGSVPEAFGTVTVDEIVGCW